ncbi:hypothetical protein [Phormidium sp. CCY1219]|nr:hypothetical protein [Phormidium sp. CCY1219]MEB3828176.1 hypothetical protein [Phormidium sp. CCY1219]
MSPPLRSAGDRGATKAIQEKRGMRMEWGNEMVSFMKMRFKICYILEQRH